MGTGAGHAYSDEQPWQWGGAKEIGMLGANITTWSDHARIEIAYLVPEEIVMIVEHHNVKARVAAMKKQMAVAGWGSAITPAMATEAGGSTAGTAVLWKSHLKCSSLVLGSMMEAQTRASGVRQAAHQTGQLLLSPRCT